MGKIRVTRVKTDNVIRHIGYFFCPKNAAKFLFVPLKIIFSALKIPFNFSQFTEVSMLKKRTKIISENYQRCKKEFCGVFFLKFAVAWWGSNPRYLTCKSLSFKMTEVQWGPKDRVKKCFLQWKCHHKYIQYTDYVLCRWLGDRWMKIKWQFGTQ